MPFFQSFYITSNANTKDSRGAVSIQYLHEIPSITKKFNAYLRYRLQNFKYNAILIIILDLYICIFSRISNLLIPVILNFPLSLKSSLYSILKSIHSDFILSSLSNKIILIYIKVRKIKFLIIKSGYFCPMPNPSRSYICGVLTLRGYPVPNTT